MSNIYWFRNIKLSEENGNILTRECFNNNSVSEAWYRNIFQQKRSRVAETWINKDLFAISRLN